MSIYIFTGPTISAEAVRRELEAVVLPPVAQGDLYRVARLKPRAIGIVDGYFEHVPAVWHKEILWAMSQGVHVYGSASMGALRAAELAAFGMIGVGAIFEAYRDGQLEDDDEVAVAHGSAETGYRVGSEAMVNIRQTLAEAEAAAVLSPTSRAELERIAKAIFYPERSYPLLLERAAEHALPAAELAAFRAWLPTGRIDQKHQDALAMLRAMRQHLATDPAPKEVRYIFEWTQFWESAVLAAGELVAEADAGPTGIPLEAVLEEARLVGRPYLRAREETLLRLLASADARRRGATVDAETHRRVTEDFRRARALLQPDDVDRWLTEQRLTREQFADLMREEALLEWSAGWAARDIARRLPDRLRLRGDFASLLNRAQAKQRRLEAGGLDNPSLADTGLSLEALVGWYAGRLDHPLPDDLARYARELGFEDREMFIRALVREHCYSQALEDRP